MNFLFIAATISLIVAPLAFFLFFAMERYRKRAKNLEVKLAALSAQMETLQKEASEIKELRQLNSRYIEQKSIAATERAQAERKMVEAIDERERHRREKEEAMVARNEAQKEYAVLQQKMADVEARMGDWEAQKNESMKAAKASILEAGGQLSSKLLEDHKREAEASKKESEEIAKKASEALVEQMLTVTKSVASLKDQTSETREKMATVWRALTTPAGAGHLAEVGLENSLKNLGLEAGRDYIMQYAITAGDGESGNLRPDAVVFLPQDMVMVIDSKASKYLMEIAEAPDAVSEEQSLARLKRTMNEHLKALVSKNYHAAIVSAHREMGRADKVRTVLNVMYLPSESAIGYLKRADDEFAQRAEKAGIILATPASLAGLLSLARINIGLAKQAANQDAIVDGVQELMDNVVTMLTFADKAGKGIKSAADNFDQFSRSVNRRMLPKLRQLVSLGVKPLKNKELPTRITGLDVRIGDEPITIEGEAESLEGTSVIEQFPQKVSA